MRKCATLFAKPFQEAVCQDKEFARAFAATILNKDLHKNSTKNIAELFGQLFYIKMLIAISDGLDSHLAKINSRKREAEDYSRFNGWGCGI